MLCEMSKIGIENDQKHIAGHIYNHFSKYYYNDPDFDKWQLKLLILKSESQMKFSQLPFIIKWKLIYRELNDAKYQDKILHISDFPNLVKAYDKTVNIELFTKHSTQGKVNYENNQPLKMLLLNCILLQNTVPLSKKIFLFTQIVKKNPNAYYDDSINIFKKLLEVRPDYLEQIQELVTLNKIEQNDKKGKNNFTCK